MQEKVVVVIKGEASYHVLEPTKDKEQPQRYKMTKNSTVTVPANTVHQVCTDYHCLPIAPNRHWIARGCSS